MGDDTAIRAKIVKAKGDVAKLAAAKTYYLSGTLKFYHGSGYNKVDVEIFMQTPDRYADCVEGMNGVQGTVVSGNRGFDYSQKATRALAADEVKSNLASLENLSFYTKFQKGEAGLRHAGSEKIKLRDLDDLIEVACEKFEKTKDKDRFVYYFSIETGELVRRWSHTFDRTGAETIRYVEYLEYEDFEGLNFALTQNTYQEIERPDKKKSFQLVRRLSVDEVILNEDFEDDPFRFPEDPFPSSLTADALVQSCAKAFKGRDPNLAEQGLLALVRAGSRSETAVAEWKKGKTTTLRHYANLALLRMGMTADPDYQAEAVRKTVAGLDTKTLDITVKAVGQLGFLLLGHGKVVLVDAPYQKGLFRVAEPALDSKTIAKADLLLFSSARRSCFDPVDAALLIKKTGATAVGPRTVISLLAKEGIAKDRLVDLTPEKGKSLSRTFDGITVHAMRTKSGKAVHNAYVLDWGSLKTLHLGATLEYKKLDPGPAKGAKLVFLPLSQMESNAADFLKTVGPLRFVVPTHLGGTPGTLTKLNFIRNGEKLPVFRKIVPIWPNDMVKF
jgi:L-ascorbate metabolism protein UlaG (beta-lactamase superfamily)